MAQGNVTGFAGFDRERDADELGDHRIGRCGDEIDRHYSAVESFGDRLIERGGIAERGIARPIDLLPGDFGHKDGREGLQLDQDRGARDDRLCGSRFFCLFDPGFGWHSRQRFSPICFR